MGRYLFHYNKPESAKRGHAVFSLHHKGKCHVVRRVVITGTVESKERRTQPRAVMQGFCDSVEVSNDTASVLGSRLAARKEPPVELPKFELGSFDY